MGSGLSMASVNKIKELANAREYSLALDILDSQDLSRSLNPQFLRLCGEIYTYNNRYRDARHVLLMAHRLAPEAKRVIYSLVYLYLKLGYWELARQYYDIYMSDADENVPETKQLMYIYDKAMKKDVDELEPYIAPTYSHTMDYSWTYETILVYMMQGRSKEAEVLAQVYSATFKNTENSLNIQDVLAGKKEAKSLFDIFADSEAEDIDPEQEADREEESKLLAADELRIHPKEAEIMIMVDDNDDEEIVPKRKLKKLLQEQERLEQEAQDDSEAEPEQTEESEKNADSDEKKEKKGFLKSIFPKKKKRDEAVENTDADSPEEKSENKSEDKSEDKSEEKEKDNHSNKEDGIETAETADIEKTSKEKETAESTETVETADTAIKEMSATDVQRMNGITEADKAKRDAEEAAYREAREIFFGEPEKRDVEEDADSAVEEKQENEETDMREIHIKERNSISNSIVSVDMGEDDFTAESDTIEDIRDNADFSNPFDSLIATKTDDSVPEYKVKKSISFETAELAEDDETDEYEIDDFSSAEDDEFGEMMTFETESPSYDETESEPDEVSEPEPEAETEEETEEEAPEPEDDIYEETEPEPETENYEESEPESEEETAEPELEDEMPEACEEPELEDEMPEACEEPEAEAEPEPEEEIETIEDIEEIAQPELEDVETGEQEAEIERIEAEQSGAYEEPEPEIDEEITEDAAEQEQLSDDYDMLFKEPPKKKLDYPVFRSSLFPDYHNETKDVENNFDEIMQEAQGKIQENILKEEQMLREAESLLASLGIELSDIAATPDSYDNMSETLYDGPSRDELKASLKIDSAKRDILRKLKEYR